MDPAEAERRRRESSLPVAAIVLVLATGGLVVSVGLLAYGSLSGTLRYGAVGYSVVAAPFVLAVVAVAAALRWRDKRTRAKRR